MEIPKEISFETLPTPIAICDGDWGGVIEQKIEECLNNKKVKFDCCYGLYQKKQDLTKYKTIVFFTTNTRVDSTQKIMDFDKSNLKCVVTVGDWAYELSHKLCKKLGIKHLDLNTLLNVLTDSEENFNFNNKK